MSNNFSTVLIERFAALDDLEYIKRKVTLVPKQQTDIAKIPPHQIGSYVEKLLNELYIPTAQDLALLKKICQISRAHSDLAYASDQHYLQGLYTPYENFEVDAGTSICLTGPAGVGKTSLLGAMRRLLPTPIELEPREDIGTVSIASHWHTQVKSRASFVDLVWPFIQNELGDTVKRPTLHRAVSLSAKTAFKSGVSLFIVNEMQFLTQSASANAAITKLLYQLSYIGTPFIYAANYSLCKLLYRRPEQDRQRILANPFVLTPSRADSLDWENYLCAVAHVLGESLHVDLLAERVTLHHLTAGLKRLVRQLLTSAYDHAWQSGQRCIKLSDIKYAYESIGYSVGREQAKAMLSPHTRKSAEYICPFPLPSVMAQEIAHTQNGALSKNILDHMLHDSLSLEEKKALTPNVESPRRPKTPRRAKVTAAELRQSNAQRLNSRSAT